MPKSRPIYLNQGDIVDWKPVPKGVVSPAHTIYQGSTVIEPAVGRGLQLDVISIMPWEIIVSGVVYQAKIRRCKNEITGNPNKEELAALADGSIDFYRHTEKLPGTQISGYAHIRSGRLWFAQLMTEQLDEIYLRQMIFEGDYSPSRVNRLLEGYAKQDFSKQEAKERALHQTYNSGREQGEYDIAGHGL